MGRGAAARQGRRQGDFLAGKYLLEDCLGIGGMGEVYRATNVSLGRKVAIKLLSPEYVHIEEDVLRFLREARAAAAVRHSNVVDVLDVAREDDGTPFIVQELLAGEDLERYLTSRNRRLSCEEALEIMIPVADAVAAAHAQNVVHRDLKPANIFLARERNRITPKVLDFGACLFPTIAERSAKEVRMLIGTPHYMAPEQIVSKQDVDARSDVWALGVILYEMIVGETPFEAGTANEVLQLVKTRDVPPLRERMKDAPADLEELIARCTKRDRLARYRDAGEVHARMLEVRRRMRGAPASSRMETLTELPVERASDGEALASSKGSPFPRPAAPNVPSLGRSGSRAKVPSLDQLAPPVPRSKQALLTLSSPGSEPPASLDDLDLDIPPPTETAGGSPSPPMPAPRAGASPKPTARGGHIDPSGVGLLQAEDTNSVRSLDLDMADPQTSPAVDLHLAARPSSWPPAPQRSSSPPRSAAAPSSMPPVLDPRAVGRVPSPIPAAPVPRELRSDAPPPSAKEGSGPTPAGKPRVAPPPERSFSASRSSASRAWTTAESVKFVVAIAFPAIAAFVAVLAIPALGMPLGRALRGDSMISSAVLAVLALVSAAALCARSLFGERSRSLYVAAAGGVLFGIVMIIVTFAASEAAELGVPSSMGGLSSAVAPIAPLALGLGALARARAAWVDPYSRSEAIRFAAFSSAMLFLMLALSPVGVVRIPARAAQAAPKQTTS